MSSPMLQEAYERKPASAPKNTYGLLEEVVDLQSNSLSKSSAMEEDGGSDEMIGTVLALLGSIMELGSIKRSDEEEKVLRSVILPALQTIAGHDNDTSIREMASDVALMIMVRGQTKKPLETETGLFLIII